MAIRKMRDATEAKRQSRVDAAQVDGRFPATTRRSEDNMGVTSAVDSEEAHGFTAKNREDIAKHVMNGNPITTAIGAVVSPEQSAAWVTRARRGDKFVIEFFQALKVEEKKALVRWSGMLEAAARGDTLKIPTGERDDDGNPRYRETTPDTKALQFLLERRDPVHFGRTSKHEHTGANGAPLAVSPFTFDASFKDWTDAETLEFAKTGRRPARLSSVPSPLNEAKAADRALEDYLKAV